MAFAKQCPVWEPVPGNVPRVGGEAEGGEPISAPVPPMLIVPRSFTTDAAPPPAAPIASAAAVLPTVARLGGGGGGGEIWLLEVEKSWQLS